MVTCPKCKHAQKYETHDSKTACAKCGLVFSKYNQVQKAEKKAQFESKVKTKALPAASEKNLPLAIGLNFVLPGVGYIYMGRVAVGICAVLLVVGILVTTPLMLFALTWIGMNIIMAIDMVILSNKQKKDSMKKCIKCAEFIKKQAVVCRYCGSSV